MEADSTASNGSSCTSYGDIPTVINIASASFSFLASVFVAATILLFKKYIIFAQRLVLYLCITAGLFSIAIATGSGPHFLNKESSSVYCVWSGFFYQQTGFMFFVALFIIILDMYLRAVKQKDTERFEIRYLLAIILTPFFVNWIPFIDSSYGEAGPWCWIRAVNSNANCTDHTLGLAMRVGIAYVPLSAGCVVAIVLYILMVRHLYRMKYIGKYDPQQQRQRKLLLKEATPFLIYPWFALFIVLFSFVNRLAALYVETGLTGIVVFWSINAAVGSSQGGVAVIVFGVNIETLRRLLRVRYYPCCWQRKIREYPMDNNDITDSFVDQERVATYTAAMYMCTLERTNSIKK